jgi:hypothetical protein
MGPSRSSSVNTGRHGSSPRRSGCRGEPASKSTRAGPEGLAGNRRTDVHQCKKTWVESPARSRPAMRKPDVRSGIPSRRGEGRIQVRTQYFRMLRPSLTEKPNFG